MKYNWNKFMNKRHLLFLSILISLTKFACADKINQNAYRKLEQNLLCNGSLNLKEIRNLVLKVNGHIPISNSNNYSGIYTLPYGLQVLNQNINYFNIIKIWNTDYSNYHYTYSTTIPNITPSEAAQLLNIPLNMESKNYQKGNLSINVINGQTVLNCHKPQLYN